MNGVVASERIFRLLDIPEPKVKTAVLSSSSIDIKCESLSFAYDENRNVLNNINIKIKGVSLLPLLVKAEAVNLRWQLYCLQEIKIIKTI